MFYAEIFIKFETDFPQLLVFDYKVLRFTVSLSLIRFMIGYGLNKLLQTSRSITFSVNFGTFTLFAPVLVTGRFFCTNLLFSNDEFFGLIKKLICDVFIFVVSPVASLDNPTDEAYLARFSLSWRIFLTLSFCM